jgi:hypothetical protein
MRGTQTTNDGDETMTTAYRIQPQGASLHGIETEASDGSPAGGVHVFRSLPEVAACREWLTEEGVELATIECGAADLREHGDYEGATLLAGRGRIVERRPFADTQAVAEWVQENYSGRPTRNSPAE